MKQALDFTYMARALRLARHGLYTTHPNPRVGCVLVHSGRIVGEGFHLRAGMPHAEINALRQAAEKARGATAYVTLEPCCHHGRTPPCSDALIRAGVSRVVVAMKDPNPLVSGNGLRQLEEAGLAVESGVLEDQAQILNIGFVSRMCSGRPWVRLKTAVSADGRTAMASGESQWITGEAARRDVQNLRAASSAIMTGSTTVLIDDPALNVRLGADDFGIGADVRQPLRVVLDTSLKTSPEARIYNLPGPCMLFTAAKDESKIAALRRRGVEVVCVARDDTGVCLAEVMRVLADREINELHVESGPVLAGSLVSQGLVDEFIIYMAPHLMGDTARGWVHLPEISKMKQRIPLHFKEVRMVGNDLRITAFSRGESQDKAPFDIF